MSGLFGIADPQGQLEIDALIAEMADTMRHREWYTVKTHVDVRLGWAVGHLGIGIFNKGTQPVWNKSRSIGVMLCGEIYDTGKQGVVSGHQTDEEVILELYELQGMEFIRQLNGAFLVLIIDVRSHKLLIATDRFSLYPLYYTSRAGRLVFAPEIKGILCDPTFPRRLDEVALVQYIRFQQLLGLRTFFEGIRRLPAASILSFDMVGGASSIQRYWSYDCIPYRPQISFDEAVEESGRLLRAAVRRLSGDSYRPGVYLSGGLDSRTILGMVERRPVTSITYGTRNSRDVYYAAKIAKAVGSQHYWFDLPDGDWVKEHVDFHLSLTEGFHSWIHSHGISTLEPARELIDVNLIGWDGGTLIGHPDLTNKFFCEPVDDNAFIGQIADMFTVTHTWPSITEAEEHLLLCQPLGEKLAGVAFDSLFEELSPYMGYRRDVRGDYFSIDHHSARLTQNMVTVQRSYFEVRIPFYDYDLVDFIYSIPARYREERKLYFALIQNETPRLALIPYDHDELLPTSKHFARRLHSEAVKWKRRINRHVYPLFPVRYTLYADYENYLRGELREWAEGILFDRRTAERGIFNVAYLRTLMERHLSRREEWMIGKIAPLITYEMMLRELYDRDHLQQIH